MHRLTNQVRHYAWGSRTHIPKLVGLPIDDRPVAEMWFGAHPSAPSRIEDGTGLDDVIGRAPVAALGARTAASFDGRLPFLMKLLAAAEPLSLQVHPSSERARIRCAQQNADGLAADAPERSYPDPSHKPELIFALTRFEGMAGFRDTTRSAEILRMFELPWLDEVANRLETTYTPSQTLRSVVTAMLATPHELLAPRLAELDVAAAAAVQRSHHPQPRMRPPDVDASSVERESLRVFDQTRALVERYPADAGVLVTLLLNHVVLAAGDAMFLPPGMIHAYTSGFGVEVMATSDNVLRAGLTAKHVDVSELLAVADFTPVPPPRWEGTTRPESGAVVFSPPVDEFALVVADVTGTFEAAQQQGPMIVLCLGGSVSVSADGDTLAIDQGAAIFVPAPHTPVVVTGEGRVAIARTPG